VNQAVAIVEGNPRPALVAGRRPAAIVPTTMEEAYRLANAVCLAGMAPRGLDTAEKAMVAIMHGLEVGLTPMAALQRIAVVNGRPTIWGDGAIGLVRGSGLCEFIHESLIGEGEKVEAVCEAKRKGEDTPIVGRFSIDDAKKAGLWAKQGPWQQFPKRMLQMRARAFCLRDAFADVLGGLYLREEIEDSAPSARQAPPPVAVLARAAAAIEHKPVVVMDMTVKDSTPAATTAAETKGAASTPAGAAPQRRPPMPPPAAPKPSATLASVMAAFKVALDAATDEDGCNAAWDSIIEASPVRLSDGDLDEVQAMLREAAQRFWTEAE
jgi:hypothetical protein